MQPRLDEMSCTLNSVLDFKGHDGNIRQFAEMLSPVLRIVILGDIDPVIDKITKLEALSPPLTH